MLTHQSAPHRRVIIVHWKNNPAAPFEIFSNLKLFCQIHPSYNYNTLNNYLSKGKTAFENERVRIERKPIVNKQPISVNTQAPHKTISFVVRKASMHEINEGEEDLRYWLSKSPRERLAAVNFIVAQSLTSGQRLDKTMIRKRKMKGKK
jgi:hypothetical protein